MEDSLGDRIWVDLDACKKLVDNICTLFQTKPYVPGGLSSSATGTGTGNVTVTGSSATSGAESPSSEGGEAGGGGGVGGSEGRQSEELALADIEVSLRLASNIPFISISLALVGLYPGSSKLFNDTC